MTTNTVAPLAPSSEREALPAPSFPGGFSVLMAVYGRDDVQLFEKAVDSVFGNTIQPDEFVLVVDGPVPELLAHTIRRIVGNQGVRPVWLPENVGLAKALNRGLQEVRTEWIARADADDVNLSDRFWKQADAISSLSGEVDLLGGFITEVDRNDVPIAVRAVPLTRERIVRRLTTRNPFNHMTVAYRTAAALSVGGYPDIHLKEDYGLWASMIANGARCLNLPDVLVRATTGRAMYKRRGGLKHAHSEVALQRHLYRLGQAGLASAIGVGAVRAAASCVPSGLRGWLYEAVLRKRHT
jgi:glycosyltransferase involved in cell wall biosynthesis